MANRHKSDQKRRDASQSIIGCNVFHLVKYNRPGFLNVWGRVTKYREEISTKLNDQYEYLALSLIHGKIIFICMSEELFSNKFSLRFMIYTSIHGVAKIFAWVRKVAKWKNLRNPVIDCGLLQACRTREETHGRLIV